MPRETKRLTDLKVKRITRPGLYADGDGVYFRVTKAGTKSWLYRYKSVAAASAAGFKIANGTISAGGKPKTYWMGLGAASTTPGDGRVSLADARAKAAELRHQRWLGNDPMATKRATKLSARLEAAKSITFKDCAAKYIAEMAGGWRNEKHRQQWANTIRDYADPIIGHLPVGTIDMVQVKRVLEPIWSTKTETATRLRGRIEQILDWARVHGYRDGDNPARWRGNLDKAGLARPSKVAKVEHHAALPYDEVPAFMAKLRAQEGTAARALEFLILTTARTGEVIGAVPAEFDLSKNIWSVPAERMKAGREHRVPLSKAASAIAKIAIEDDAEFLFPGRRAKTPMSNMAMAMLLRRMGYDEITVHGFRSTFRDWAAEQGHPRDLAEMALAHLVTDETEAAYFRSDLLQRRRALAEGWSRFCAQPPKKKGAGDNVVALRRKAVAD